MNSKLVNAKCDVFKVDVDTFYKIVWKIHYKCTIT